MKSPTLLKFLPAALLLALLFNGCAKEMASKTPEAPPAASQQAKKQPDVYMGSIVGRSNKAKTISIAVGKGDDAQPIMVRFDDNTKGLEFAESGEAAIIAWEQRGDDKFATEIKPKLAKLPEGVTEVKVDEMHALLDANTPMLLVDSRPKARYDQAHLPGAANIPVPALQEKKSTLLPADKNMLLVFYCGGYT